MTKEDKEILLKDLCCRLPYNCRVFYEYVDNLNGKTYGYSMPLNTWCIDEFMANKAVIKPYLFPFSSMTEEQKMIYSDYCYEIMHSIAWDGQFRSNELYDWLNKNHFDYRGLIPMGSAIDATGLNIY